MAIRQLGLNFRELDKIFEILLEGLKDNARLNEKRNLVNSILPMDKYTLLHRFLSDKKGLRINLRLNCLPIFLDKNTKYFSFVQNLEDQETIISLLEIIMKYCPNIEIIDFRELTITSPNTENFKIFLNRFTQLKSLRVNCFRFIRNCAMCQLLLNEEFDRHDLDVQIGLKKIDFIHGRGLTGPECAKILKILPNLKSFGTHQNLSALLPYYTNDEVIVQKLSNITEFGDMFTTLPSLQCFSKVCRKAKKIYLCRPNKNVVENLWNFPLLTEIIIDSADLDFGTELINLLNKIGKQIQILEIGISDRTVLDQNIVEELCPELVQLEIKKKFL